MRKQFLFFLSLFSLTFVEASSALSECEECQNEYVSSNEKAYVNPDDLLIIEHNIFLKGYNQLIPLYRVETDEYGLFVEMKGPCEIRPGGPQCINGHPIYHECGGCAHWWCNCRCMCYSPWLN